MHPAVNPQPARRRPRRNLTKVLLGIFRYRSLKSRRRSPRSARWNGLLHHSPWDLKWAVLRLPARLSLTATGCGYPISDPLRAALDAGLVSLPEGPGRRWQAMDVDQFRAECLDLGEDAIKRGVVSQHARQDCAGTLRPGPERGERGAERLTQTAAFIDLVALWLVTGARTGSCADRA
jgi:hypothetical protein